MLELLQFYVSGFWTWLGLTIGLTSIFGALGATVTRLRVR